MITMTLLQRFAVGYGAYDLLELTQILASLLNPLEILFELAGLKNRFHAFQLSKSFSVESNRSKFRPFRESSSALTVTSFGIATSNGRPLRKAICV
jgi:hypothetical protein